MPKLVCTFASNPEAHLTICVADQNKVRWTLAALRSNEQLSTSLAATATVAGHALLVDSNSVLDGKAQLRPGTHVILWDGYNSYIELAQSHKQSILQHVRFVTVGNIDDLLNAYPNCRIPLFLNDTASPNRSSIRAPWWIEARIGLRTRARMFRNACADSRRHRRLRGDRLVVFCGLVRPPLYAIADITRGSDLSAIADKFGQLLNLPLGTADDMITRPAGAIYNAVRNWIPVKLADIAAAYAITNLLHRVIVIDRVFKTGTPIFLSEYGRDRPIDPYDSGSYRQHLYLDFGSLRGPDLLYPRTSDIRANGKQSISLRYLGEKGSLVDFLRVTTLSDFMKLCDQHAKLVSSDIVPNGNEEPPAMKPMET